MAALGVMKDRSELSVSWSRLSLLGTVIPLSCCPGGFCHPDANFKWGLVCKLSAETNVDSAVLSKT